MGRPKKYNSEAERVAAKKEYNKEYHKKVKSSSKRYCTQKTLDNSIKRIMTCDKYMIQMLKSMGKAKVDILMEKL
jgi:hypothetical protein